MNAKLVNRMSALIRGMAADTPGGGIGHRPSAHFTEARAIADILGYLDVGAVLELTPDMIIPTETNR